MLQLMRSCPLGHCFNVSCVGYCDELCRVVMHLPESEVLADRACSTYAIVNLALFILHYLLFSDAGFL